MGSSSDFFQIKILKKVMKLWNYFNCLLNKAGLIRKILKDTTKFQFFFISRNKVKLRLYIFIYFLKYNP